MRFNLDLCIYIKSMQEQTPLKLCCNLMYAFLEM